MSDRCKFCKETILVGATICNKCHQSQNRFMSIAGRIAGITGALTIAVSVLGFGIGTVPKYLRSQFGGEVDIVSLDWPESGSRYVKLVATGLKDIAVKEIVVAVPSFEDAKEWYFFEIQAEVEPGKIVEQRIEGKGSLRYIPMQSLDSSDNDSVMTAKGVQDSLSQGNCFQIRFESSSEENVFEEFTKTTNDQSRVLAQHEARIYYYSSWLGSWKSDTLTTRAVLEKSEATECAGVVVPWEGFP